MNEYIHILGFQQTVYHHTNTLVQKAFAETVEQVLRPGEALPSKPLGRIVVFLLPKHQHGITRKTKAISLVIATH